LSWKKGERGGRTKAGGAIPGELGFMKKGWGSFWRSFTS